MKEFFKKLWYATTNRTDKRCPRCNKRLLKSDLPEYTYLCPNCDENFYDIEVK